MWQEILDSLDELNDRALIEIKSLEVKLPAHQAELTQRINTAIVSKFEQASESSTMEQSRLSLVVEQWREVSSSFA